MPDKTPLLELKDIHKKFPGVYALQGVSFDLYPGEVHALLGENGAGKSTLVKIMSGIYAKDQGEIVINGKPVQITNANEPWKMIERHPSRNWCWYPISLSRKISSWDVNRN